MAELLFAAEGVSPDPRRFLRALSASLRAGKRHSRIKVLLPEPLTPVTTTNRPSGKSMVRSFKLFLSAFFSVSQTSVPDILTLDFGPAPLGSGPSTGLRFPRVGYALCVRRHLPV